MHNANIQLFYVGVRKTILRLIDAKPFPSMSPNFCAEIPPVVSSRVGVEIDVKIFLFV